MLVCGFGFDFLSEPASHCIQTSILFLPLHLCTNVGKFLLLKTHFSQLSRKVIQWPPKPLADLKITTCPDCLDKPKWPVAWRVMYPAWLHLQACSHPLLVPGLWIHSLNTGCQSPTAHLLPRDLPIVFPITADQLWPSLLTCGRGLNAFQFDPFLGTPSTLEYHTFLISDSYSFVIINNSLYSASSV